MELMITRNKYDILLKELKGLSDSELYTIVKTIHFLKREILQKKQGNIAEVLEFAGIWKDIPRKEVEIFSEIIQEREKFSKGRAVFE